jgi:hypothetical protein
MPVLMLGLVSACSDTPASVSGSEPSEEKSAALKVERPAENQNKKTVLAPREDPVVSTAQISRSAEAHTHGNAELAVVLEKGRVTVELESPLYNILGFEHAAETPAQKTRVSQAESQLAKAAVLFGFDSDADCKAASTNQTVALFDVSAKKDSHSDHDHHSGDDHQGEEGEPEAGNHSNESRHKDIVLRYEYLCENPSALSNVSVNLFEFFENLSEIDVTYLGPSIQKQETLTRNSWKMDVSQ